MRRMTVVTATRMTRRLDGGVNIVIGHLLQSSVRQFMKSRVGQKRQFTLIPNLLEHVIVAEGKDTTRQIVMLQDI